MKIAITVARVLLGLVFFVFGLNGFLQFIPAPPMEGLAGQWTQVMMQSHYLYFVSGVQVIAGALLLVNRFVPLALGVLAAVLANILTFHITMAPAGMVIPLVCTALWLFLVLQLRAYFAPLFVARASYAERR